MSEQLELTAGKKLDALVAENIMGYSLDYSWHPYVNLVDSQGNYVETKCMSDEDAWSYCPNYSTDIGAAMNILLTKYAGRWEIEAISDDKFLVVIYHSKKGYRGYGSSAVEDGPLPVAICKAALKIGNYSWDGEP